MIQIFLLLLFLNLTDIYNLGIWLSFWKYWGLAGECPRNEVLLDGIFEPGIQPLSLLSRFTCIMKYYILYIYRIYITFPVNIRSQVNIRSLEIIKSQINIRSQISVIERLSFLSSFTFIMKYYILYIYIYITYLVNIKSPIKIRFPDIIKSQINIRYHISGIQPLFFSCQDLHVLWNITFYTYINNIFCHY